MRKQIAVLVIIAMALVGMAGAANYMYEKASVKGVGYQERRDDHFYPVGLHGPETGREGVRLR